MRPKKFLGQHFLHDPRILGRIADSLAFTAGDAVLEIGPGRGALTAELLSRGAVVTAIEKDRDLLPGLVRKYPALRLAHGDAMDLDWPALAGVAAGNLKVIGNIPYNITSPLIDKALTPPRPQQVVFLVQKEVADRVAAGPGGGTYGALSVGVQAVAMVERLFVIPAGAFQPPPKVDSAVIRLTPLAEPLVTDKELAGFRRLVTGLFSARRKQLQRGLRQLTGWSGELVDARLAGLGIEGTRRPETLSPVEFVALYRALVDGGWGSRVAL
jgi:16S rRNA (adenine1518-N6/adenine1519-N6)-dimethyltransferase